MSIQPSAPPADGEAMPQSVPLQEDPPPYEATVARVAAHNASEDATERRPLIQSRPAMVARQSEPTRDPEFSIQKFLFLWLGIGYPYGFCCMFLHGLFLGVGIAVAVLTVAGGNGDGLTSGDNLHVAKALTVAAGLVFIFLSTLWPCVWYWKHHMRQRGWRFVLISCYAWILSLLYIGVATALASQVYEHHDIIFDYGKQARDFNLTVFADRLPSYTLVPMTGLLAAFALCSCLICGCCAAAGRIF